MIDFYWNVGSDKLVPTDLSEHTPDEKEWDGKK